MTPHNINRERFDYLVGAALRGRELKSFFKDKRQPLIMCGVKVQNPPGDAAAAKVLIHQFSEKAHRIFGAWIQELEDQECRVGPDQWIPRYRAVEEYGVEFPADEMAAMARAGLKELYKENAREDWIQFLSTPPNGNAEDEESSGKIAPPRQGEWLAFGEWLCGLGSLDGLASPILRDAAAIVAQWDRRAHSIELTTEEGRQALPLVEQLIKETQRPAVPIPARKGLHAAAPVMRAREQDADYLALPVIATRVHSPRSGPYMARVEAFVDESGPFRLDESELREVVKTKGRIAVFPDRGFSEPLAGEAVMYKVEPHVTHLPVQVRAKEVLDSGLIRVVRLPYSAKEAQQIRRAIEEYASTARVRPAVFVTTDDLCLKPSVDPLTRVSAPDYDWVLDTWGCLDGLELSGGSYVLAPLPSPTGKLSCAPLAAAAVRLLRDRQRRTQVNLTRHQANLLKDLLRDESLAIDDLSRERLAENIQLLATAGEEYDELMDLLMKSPSVRTDVDRRVELRVAELTAEKQKETRAIEALRQERELLETKLKGLRWEADQRAKEVRVAVGKAFEKATKKEIEALGEASVLRALIGRDQPSIAQIDAVSFGTAPEVTVANSVTEPHSVFIRRIASSGRDIGDVFRRFGLPSDTCERVTRSLRATVALGLPIVTRGSGSRVLAEDLAAAFSSECAICEVPVGLIANERLETRLWNGNEGGVLLLDANLSDVSVYAPGILNAVVAAALGRSDALVVRRLMLSLSSGPAGLPLPAELDELAVKLDLSVLSGAFIADDRVPSHPHGTLAKRALKRLDTDTTLATLDLTPAVLDDLNWLLCQPAS